MHQKDGTVTYTYDALGLRAEQVNGTSAVQSIYDPLGIKMVLATPGRVLWDAYIPLVGGAMANYVQTALSSYWHPDWLGTGRLGSTPSQTPGADAAFAPFGEQYLPSFSFDDIWTGCAFQDTATDLWDFPAREYHPTQGRFVSPDPAGAAAVDPSNPQSWDRYAYVMNNPNSLIDPLGLWLPEASPAPTTVVITQAGQVAGSTGNNACGGGAQTSKGGRSIWTATFTFPQTAAGAIVGSLAGPGGLPGALIGSMIGVGRPYRTYLQRAASTRELRSSGASGLWVAAALVSTW